MYNSKEGGYFVASGSPACRLTMCSEAMAGKKNLGRYNTLLPVAFNKNYGPKRQPLVQGGPMKAQEKENMAFLGVVALPPKACNPNFLSYCPWEPGRHGKVLLLLMSTGRWREPQ